MRNSFRYLSILGLLGVILLSKSFLMANSDAKEKFSAFSPENRPNAKGTPYGRSSLISETCFGGTCGSEATDNSVSVYINIEIKRCEYLNIQQLQSKSDNNLTELKIEKHLNMDCNSEKLSKVHETYSFPYKKGMNKVRIHYQNEFVDLKIPKDYKYYGLIH